ncbi:MAG: Abi family protein [Leptospiraceae bacterium]|nr:Abi family protein [Leptospiraceae bacterium]MCP5498882.1 Abi family protein [Leptospiraceae bacterium]
MIYNKPPLSFPQQADQLLKRGLIADRDDLIHKLQQVSYYRLSGYWFPFRKFPDDHFKKDTHFKTIWNRYVFDRQLRLLVLDGIERIEISLRTNITYILGHETGPFGYTENSNLPNLQPDKHALFLEEIQKEYSRSKETFVSHFQTKYGDEHDVLPIWMVTELISFGTLFTMYRGAKKVTVKTIAKKYKLSEKVLVSWLGSLNTVRNICAHHSRFWNRELGYKPMIPNKDQTWKRPVVIKTNRIFVILCIIRYMLNFIAPQSNWQDRLLDLLDRYPEIPKNEMGFPDNWRSIAFWKNQDILLKEETK